MYIFGGGSTWATHDEDLNGEDQEEQAAEGEFAAEAEDQEEEEGELN